MNNNYFFNPNANLMRYVPYTNIMNTARGATSLPKISSLFSSTPKIAASSAPKITFSGILNGASKTLGVINQAIPVVHQVKPIWKNAKTMFKVAKEINNSNNNNATTKKTPTLEKKQTSNFTSNGPTFFA